MQDRVADITLSSSADTVAGLVGVSHRYGKTHALAVNNLIIPCNRLVGVIGPDGVGKSTLLALLAGVRKMQQGQVRVLGGDMADTHHRRVVNPRIAYMPQGLGKNLYPTLSVFENVDFFARLFAQQRSEREIRIAELLVSTGLEPFRDRPAGKLSGGMKQKLGLCCALIHDPDLLILDEPTTGVDPLSRRQFWSLVERIRNSRAGMSVIVATAYMDEAEKFDWLVAMDSGQVLADGSPQELMQRTGTKDLDAAFIELLRETRQHNHQALVVPPQHSESAGPPVIRAKGLSKRFGDFTAVDQVSFEIKRGEIFGFLGSNGCGKTTTMKMLTGLLPITEGKAELLGHQVDARDLETRKRVGFMSQAFSLYSELSVRQNLVLHARLFHLPKTMISARSQELIERFELTDYVDELVAQLPLGIRQRLSLAVALIHRPEILILDEPTSGVDPIARDQFWQLLIDLSRNDGVTIFVSTHFMNEAERCDRISLMHAGKVLASDTPATLTQAKNAPDLEEAFISYLEDATGEQPDVSTNLARTVDADPAPAAYKSYRNGIFNPLRLFGYARREALEIRRDPIRLAFALVGTALLMLVLGYGISFDVEDIAFAVLDYDRSPESRHYIESFSGSRYFVARAPLSDDMELERRMRSGELSLTLEIPSGFGKDLLRGRRPEVAAWVDAAMPFRAETINGYLQGIHNDYLNQRALLSSNPVTQNTAVELAIRYRYNQDFKSLYAVVPATIPLLLALIPAILMALGVVREKELGSIINFYATPTNSLEFLLGKQLPYIAISMINFFGLVLLALYFFDVPLKGSMLALSVAALLYVTVMTGWGLLISTFTQSQTAAIFGTAIATMVPATQFSGLNDPVSSLEGAAAIIGKLFPTTYFMIISRGTFTKALGFTELYPYFFALAAFIPVLTVLSVLLLRKQER